MLYCFFAQVMLLSLVRLFATPWTVACQAQLSMGFSKQEYWSGLPFPSPGDLPDSGIKLGSPALKTDSLSSEPAGKTIAFLVLEFSKCNNVSSSVDDRVAEK